jgi:hypothetical protein
MRRQLNIMSKAQVKDRSKEFVLMHSAKAAIMFKVSCIKDMK